VEAGVKECKESTVEIIIVWDAKL